MKQSIYENGSHFNPLDSSHKNQKSIPFWAEALTRLPYCRLTSRLIDQQIAKSEGGLGNV